MSADELRAWLARNSVSQDTCARLVGKKRRQIAYYLTGAQEVPFLIAVVLKQIDGRVPQWEAAVDKYHASR